MGRPQAGSDEGGRWGFHGVGKRPTGPRWQRDSSTLRYYEIAPSSVSSVDSFPPRGSLRYYDTLELLTTVIFYISHTGLVNRLPLGGKVGRPQAGSDEGEP